MFGVKLVKLIFIKYFQDIFIHNHVNIDYRYVKCNANNILYTLLLRNHQGLLKMCLLFFHTHNAEFMAAHPNILNFM
jgi:hypothetical protein